MSTSQQSTRQLKQTCELKKDTSGGYCGGVPPLPIPNREVKPTCADGTAMQCGRVGSRLLLLGAPRTVMSLGLLFLCQPFFQVSSLCPLGSPISVNPYGELSFPFHPFTRERHACPCCPLLPSASYPSRILMQKAWLLDADCNVT